MKTNNLSLLFTLIGGSACALGLASCLADTTTSSNDGGTGTDTTKKDDGGTVGTGDTGGGGGDPKPGACSTAGMTVEMIDDMESATGSIISKAGRVGAWYTYNDATAGSSQQPGTPFVPTVLAPPRDTSTYAARTNGSGFTTWGAGMGFNYNDPGDGAGGSKKDVYDASAYSAVTFCAKAAAPTNVRINISNKDTDPAGAVCAPAAKCSDHFGKSLNLTTEWTQYTVKFSDLAQGGWGQAVPKFNPATLYATQFQVAKGITFDLYIDDVQFVAK